jgi:RimJ/RimL family protein N-acetyltransferase
MRGEPKVYRFIAGKPSSREECWNRLLRYVGHWTLLNFGYWAIEEKISGEYIGETGFGDFKRDITPSLDGTIELGWALAPAYHKKGYATEALTTIIAWGEQNLDCIKTSCIISPENTASIRVAEKFGFIEVARTTYKDDPMILYHRPTSLHGRA